MESGGQRIRITGLAKSFGADKRVLRDVNLELFDGETLVVLGKNGAGKSVLFKLIDALLFPDAGEVLVDGENIHRLSGQALNRARLKFGYVFQKSGLFDSLTVGENVAFPLRRYTDKPEKEIRHIVADKLRQVGLGGMEDKMPAELSGGMQKRAGLARAIALGPEIILYDDPTAGLDPVLTDAIASLIMRMRAELKVSTMVITNDLILMRKIADRACLLYQGAILGPLPLAQFLESPDPVIRQFLTAALEGPIDLLA